ncbi:MAG: pyridoxal-phosphate dependent enzyme [Leeuwenhoekiella sp.]
MIAKAYSLIKPYVHRTPVMTSRLLDEMSNAQLFFKCENFQRAGAYKIRGATHAILNLSNAQKNSGVVTHSSGNFAQALALAAKSLDISATIVMPDSAPKVKIDAVRQYGAKIIMCEPTLAAREETANAIVNDTGATFIHPSNNIQVILGQGTACFELLQEYPNIDIVINPLGGGGLIAGSCLAAKELNPNVKVVGAEPFAVDDAYRSLHSGKIETNASTETIADGLKTQLGDKNFPIILKQVDEIFRVEEADIILAMQLLWERMKIVVEPSSAVCLAAVLKYPNCFAGKNVGVVLSGGNVDLSRLPF